MKFTGERLVPGINYLENMITEELARLDFGKPYYQKSIALDFGCGAGYSTNHLTQKGARFVVGVDISTEAIQFAQRSYQSNNTNYSQMDCLHSAFADQSFDFICSLDVIEHFSEQNINIFLSEIKRILKPNGYCLITTPNKYHSSPNKINPSWRFHQHEFLVIELDNLLKTHFSQVNIFGSRVPIYEDNSIRFITNSRLSYVKHFLPAKIRVGFSSGLRFLLKSNLQIDDVKISKDNIEYARVFVAICKK